MIGRLSSSTLAAEAVVLAAAEAQGLALDSANKGQIDFELAHRASLLSAQAKVFIDEIAPRAASLMYELGGASSTLRTTGLDEHWRNIVTLSAHNPAAFKARAIGDYLVNGTKLPANLYF
jgi:alkylation response protein AidB-like acyl-CoA dehydrogenase